MANRATQRVVRFAAPFLLPGADALAPAGDSRADCDEDSFHGASGIVWRRVGSFIPLPAMGARGSTRQMAPIHPADLDAALEKDNNT